MRTSLVLLSVGTPESAASKSGLLRIQKTGCKLQRQGQHQPYRHPDERRDHPSKAKPVDCNDGADDERNPMKIECLIVSRFTQDVNVRWLPQPLGCFYLVRWSSDLAANHDFTAGIRVNYFKTTEARQLLAIGHTNAARSPIQRC
jgi:hypothetical protein